VHYEQQGLGQRTSDRGVTGLVEISRVDVARERIEEHLARQLKRDSMLKTVPSRFLNVPFKVDAIQAILNRSAHSVLTIAIRGKWLPDCSACWARQDHAARRKYDRSSELRRGGARPRDEGMRPLQGATNEIAM
jgi:hypothetical protein